MISNRKIDDAKTLVYPVPLPNTQVLGIHSTLCLSGHVKIGPTVTPALSAENYQGTEGINFGEMVSIMGTYVKAAVSKNKKVFFNLAFKEARKNNKRSMMREI